MKAACPSPRLSSFSSIKQTKTRACAITLSDDLCRKSGAFEEKAGNNVEKMMNCKTICVKNQPVDRLLVYDLVFEPIII